MEPPHAARRHCKESRDAITTVICAPAVVFGRVEEGMQVVKAIEAVGTQSGKTKKRVTIVDCGELPSKRMILKRIRQEKEELANLKKDPISVRSDLSINDTSPSIWSAVSAKELLLAGTGIGSVFGILTPFRPLELWK